MSGVETFDVVVVGGGIVGLATAMALGEAGRRVLVLEKETELAAHQTGRNSGVIHSGLYYRPGSLKARLCAAGREAMFEFCARRGIPCERCGKIVVATDERDRARLDELERRGRANGLTGLRRLSPAEIRAIEPHAAGVDGLHVPQTGIVDFREVCRAMADEVRERGGAVRLGTPFLAARPESSGLIVHTPRERLYVRGLVNCAGLHSDRVARRCGVEPDVAIVPFRGEYYTIRPERRWLVRNLIYPVPDPRFPFLGVHFTRRITGEVEAGPNAVLAFRREGYRRSDVSLLDLAELATYGGFWRMAARHWRMGLDEFRRSLSRHRFAEALRRLVPEIRDDDLAPGGAGVRAQAVARDGSLVDDFRIVQAPRMVHVLNAPSPAATASIAIGRSIARYALENFG
ncbi:MAG: L-2-hydroxyglutarate oxidase [Kiritimatiellae bacterium]|nr:L-2-hydroxyglutarate oxidase [Kiritimatiellia bacterium]